MTRVQTCALPISESRNGLSPHLDAPGLQCGKGVVVSWWTLASDRRACYPTSGARSQSAPALFGRCYRMLSLDSIRLLPGLAPAPVVSGGVEDSRHFRHDSGGAPRESHVSPCITGLSACRVPALLRSLSVSVATPAIREPCASRPELKQVPCQRQKRLKPGYI